MKRPDNVHPIFWSKVEAFLRRAEDNCLSVGIHMSYRSFAEQDALYAQGRTKPGKIITKARGGESWHNYGLAVDVVFKDPKGAWSWAETHPWEVLGSVGKFCGLVWGGDFKGIRDRPHFEWHPGLTLAEAQGIYRKAGLAEVWLAVKFA